MKKGLIVIIIAAVMLTACALELTYVHNTFDKMEFEITSLMAEIEKDDENVRNPQTLQMVNGISELWDKRKRLAEVMLNHILLIEYDSKIARLKSDIEVDDRDLAKVDADQLHTMTVELKELHTPHIHNIF